MLMAEFKGLKIADQHYDLLVLDIYKKGKSRTYIKVKCKCENISEIRSDTIFDRRSCRDCMMKKAGERKRSDFINNEAFKRIYNQYKRNALKKDREFNLDESQFKELIDSRCFYCNSEVSNLCKVSSAKKNYIKQYLYNGIDRLDNSKGYTIDNTVACCKKCNIAKSSMSTVEWFVWLNNIYKNLSKINTFLLSIDEVEKYYRVNTDQFGIIMSEEVF